MKETGKQTWCLISSQSYCNECRKLPSYVCSVKESQHFDASLVWRERPCHVSKHGSDGSAGRARLETNSLTVTIPCPEGFNAKNSLSVARISEYVAFIRWIWHFESCLKTNWQPVHFKAMLFSLQSQMDAELAHPKTISSCCMNCIPILCWIYQ